MFYFKFHIGDYRRDTNHLSLIEHAIYMNLMFTYYINESPLPKDSRQLMRLAGARTEDEKQAVIDVVSEFFTETETHWVHSRIDFELQQYQAKASINRENGKKGGRPKKKTQGETENNPDGYDSLKNKTQTVSDSKPNDNPDITLTNKPINPLTNNIDIVFDFWKKTFDKSDRTLLKGKRESVIRARLRDGYSVDEIKQAIVNLSNSQYHIENGHVDIELICRNQVNLDKYISMGGSSSLVVKEQEPQSEDGYETREPLRVVRKNYLD